ncbi:MAG: hypothetical protein J6K13_04655 [Clostridia bacterium]|nr:hypothetical protein [Clostridia bacterium]
MLARLTEAEFDQWAGWAYDLATTPEHASYPSYRDGIKTREDFIQRARRGLEDEEILLFRHEGKVCGWIQWYAIPEEHYAQTVSFLVESHAEEAAQTFAAHVAQACPGFTLDIGLDGANAQAAAALEKAGFALMDSSVNHTLMFDRYEPCCVPEHVRLMQTQDEAEFRRVHDEPDMYWNADRMLTDAGRWRIYLYWQESRATSVLCCMLDDGWPEIFAIEFENDVFRPEIYRDLMAACLRDAKAAGCPYMTYFEEEEQALPILAALGFDAVGRYAAYRKEL